MALWQSFKIIGNPSLMILKDCTAVPSIVQIVHNSGKAVACCDDEIKWQWAVRCKPNPNCPHSCVPKTKCTKKQGWIAWLMRKKPEPIIVDKENCPPRKPERTPRIWELEYYSYLLPESYLKPKPSLESCRMQIMEDRLSELDRDSIECLTKDVEEKKPEKPPCKKVKHDKILEPQPCPPPLPEEPRYLVVRNCRALRGAAKKKVPASMDEFEVKMPYEDVPLKIATSQPKQYKFKAKVKTQWKSFPPISDEEVQLLCRLDYKNAQFKYVECPKSMYTRYKNVSEDEGLAPVSCKCTLRPADQPEGPPIGRKKTGGEDMFKCQHPLHKQRH